MIYVFVNIYIYIIYIYIYTFNSIIYWLNLYIFHLFIESHKEVYHMIHGWWSGNISVKTLRPLFEDARIANVSWETLRMCLVGRWRGRNRAGTVGELPYRVPS